MNTIRINGMTIEFENGIEVIAEGEKVVVRKVIQRMNARGGILPAAIASNPIIPMPMFPRRFPRFSNE